MKNSRPVESFAVVSSGSSLSSARHDVRAVKVGDLDGSGMLPAQLSAAGAPKSGLKARLVAGDVVLSVRGTTNYAAPVTQTALEAGPLFATLDVASIRLHSDSGVLPAYLAAVLNQNTTQNYLAAFRTGAAAPRLPLEPIRNLEVSLPPVEQQRTLLRLIEMKDREDALHRQLGNSRASLINQLLCHPTKEGPATEVRSVQAT